MILRLHLAAVIETTYVHFDCRSVMGITISDLRATVATELAVPVLRRLVTRRYSARIRKVLSPERDPGKDWSTSRPLAQFAVAITGVYRLFRRGESDSLTKTSAVESHRYAHRRPDIGLVSPMPTSGGAPFVFLAEALTRISRAANRNLRLTMQACRICDTRIACSSRARKKCAN